jgi:hypothetical protein
VSTLRFQKHKACKKRSSYVSLEYLRLGTALPHTYVHMYAWTQSFDFRINNHNYSALLGQSVLKWRNTIFI